MTWVPPRFPAGVLGKAQFACSASFIEEVTKGVLFKTEEEHLLKIFFFFLFDFSCQFFLFLLVFPSKTLCVGGFLPALPRLNPCPPAPM